jgi:hypothetical protein
MFGVPLVLKTRGWHRTHFQRQRSSRCRLDGDGTRSGGEEEVGEGFYSLLPRSNPSCLPLFVVVWRQRCVTFLWRMSCILIATRAQHTQETVLSGMYCTVITLSRMLQTPRRNSHIIPFVCTESLPRQHSRTGG